MKAELPFLRFAASLIFACTLSIAQPAVTLIAHTPDNSHKAVVSDHGRIHCRGTGKNAVEQTFYLCNAQALSFSADGKFLAAAGGRNGCQAKIKVWRIADGKQLCEILTVGDAARTLALSTDGSLAVCASADGRVDAWRVSDGKPQWSRTVTSAAKSIQFSADAKELQVQCIDGAKRTLVAANGRSVPQNHSAAK